MDGVVDGIQTVLLGAGGQIELALGCAELAVHTPCQVVLGGSLHVGLQILAQQLSKLSSVFSLFPSCLLPVQADLGVALAVCDTGHAQVHTNLGALAIEVGHELIEDVLLVLSGDVGVVLYGLCVNAILMDSSQLLLALLLNELGSGNLADGAAEIGRQFIAGIDVTTDRTYKLFHDKFLQKINFKII